LRANGEGVGKYGLLSTNTVRSLSVRTIPFHEALSVTGREPGERINVFPAFTNEPRPPTVKTVSFLARRRPAQWLKRKEPCTAS